jgi:hypothetical protein
MADDLPTPDIATLVSGHGAHHAIVLKGRSRRRGASGLGRLE